MPLITAHCPTGQAESPCVTALRAALGFCLHCTQRPPALGTQVTCTHCTPGSQGSSSAASCRAHHLCFSFWKGSWAPVDRAAVPPTQCCLSQGLVRLHRCGQTVSCLSNLFLEVDFSTQSLMLTAPSS